MNINEFLNSYGFSIIYGVIGLFIIVGLVIDVLQFRDGNGSVSRMGSKILMMMFITIVFGFLKSGNETQMKVLKSIENFWGSIDWNFWAYYVLVPFIVTILVIAIINAIKAKPASK